MPGPLAPPQDDDDEIPQYSPLTTLLAGSTWQPQDDHTAQIQPQAAQPVATQMAAAQPAQPIATAPQPIAAAPTSGPTLPPIPQSYSPDLAMHQQYEAQLAKDSAPTDRKANGPKWYDRIAGAAVGFGTGFKDGPTAGIRAGSAVTNRNYDNAEADRQTRVAADNSAISNLNRKDDEGYKGYESAMQGYNGQMEAVSARDREAAQKAEQDDRDRNFGRAVDNDKREQDNEDNNLDLRERSHADETKEQATRDAETARHNRAEEGIGYMDAGKGSTKDKDGNPRTTMTLKQFQDVLSKRDADYTAAKNQYIKQKADNPDGAEADYQSTLTNLQREWNDRLAQADPEGKYAPKPAAGAPPATQGGQSPAAPKKLTDVTVARQYLKRANGNKEEARKLAQNDGYTF